jgi:hypothetical protein
MMNVNSKRMCFEIKVLYKNGRNFTLNFLFTQISRHLMYEKMKLCDL